jgi:hypothetical protein
MTRAKDISKIVTDADLSGTLDVTGTVTAGGLSVQNTAASNAQIAIENTSAATSTDYKIVAGKVGVSNEGFSIYDSANTTTAYYIDSSGNHEFLGGNVGIGTTSPSRSLHIVSSGTTTPMRIDSGSSAASLIDFKDTATTADFKVRVGSTGDNFVAYAGGTERMRIDSSGNLLVGKTSTAIGTVGFRVDGANGFATITRDGFESLILNRKTSDGDIAKFQKDGTTVGSIGTKNGALHIGSTTGSDSYLGFYSDAIIPTTSDGSDRNNAIDLGYSGSRFNSLFLSGQVSLDNGTTSGFLQSSGDLTQFGTSNAKDVVFYSNNTERMRIDSNGRVGFGQTPTLSIDGSVGLTISEDGYMQSQRSGTPTTIFVLNRIDTDGTYISFRQAGLQEGTISVSGTTVSYNGGHLSRWSQLADNTRDNTIVKGTVMTNLDQMAEWTTDGVTEDNEQLNCMAVSSVEGDANVAGVFVNWDDDDIYTNDMNIAMTGDMVIRIAQGTTVARGDLLMSAGDGTAKPQGDDIVRSKTIAKVTSTNVSHTYDDGTYLVPCVLMAC